MASASVVAVVTEVSASGVVIVLLCWLRLSPNPAPLRGAEAAVLVLQDVALAPYGALADQSLWGVVPAGIERKKKKKNSHD